MCSLVVGCPARGRKVAPVLAFCANKIRLATILDTSRVLSHFSRVRLFATPRPVARQAPLSVEFSRQEYWSPLPFPSLGDLLDPRIKLWSPALQADSLLLQHLTYLIGVGNFIG